MAEKHLPASGEGKSFREKYLPPDATTLRRVHGGLTVLWILLIAPTLLWWSESILWVALMSIWANIASHWAAWQAARGEVKVDEQADS